MTDCSRERQYRERRSGAAAWHNSKREVAIDTESLVLVGIDWASSAHQVRSMGAEADGPASVRHNAAGIGAMVDWLCSQAKQPGQVSVAIETPHGPVVEALLDRGIAVFDINPK
ncbi:hypothetical protein, partial [Acidiphilium sp.]